jgi:hypothetical protein
VRAESASIKANIFKLKKKKSPKTTEGVGRKLLSQDPGWSA